MKLKSISRTATFAWDLSSSSEPLIVTGAVAGALDENFSNESALEIWKPDFSDGAGMRMGGEGKGPEGSISVSARFNRLAWSYPSTTNGRGVIAAGMETGEVNVYDPEKILKGATADEARIFRNDKHTGPVRGVDFNPIQKNLMLTGAVNAELYIFDLNNPSNAPIPPGATSTKLNEITAVQWNHTISRVFAASSSSGFTSVWDLKTGKEVASLQYGGGAAKGRDAVVGTAGMQLGKRRGMSDVCWHPEQATRLITASEDDESPIIMLWDLRNTRAPERILSGHHKGVLSVSWCRQDADLLLSCGKDNRTLCWNPQTGEIIGELPASNDWSFQTTWCPRNPDLLATASFDGHIGIHSLQTTQEISQPSQSFSEDASADDIFGALGNQESPEDTANVLSLKQPPKWLRRPISATFGFGGLLASTSNLAAAGGKHQSGVVHLRHVVTEEGIIERAKSLDETAGYTSKLADFCAQKQDAGWKALQSLFKANSRDELVQLLGFSKEDVRKHVEEAIKKYPSFEIPTEKPSLVSFKEPEPERTSQDEEEEAPDTPTTGKAPEGTPSEVSAASDVTKRTEATEMTEHSLFDDHEPGTPAAAAADFFSSMASGAGSIRNPVLDHVIPHKAEVPESSAAATIGSRASSLRSEVIKDNTFHIYPAGESEVDKLVTQALVLGDFKSAVDLCLASERFADALLLAVRGGPDLLQSTQKAYFTRRTTSLPFLRVFQSIVTEDLADIVQNADLGEWKVAFVVLCTFAKDGDFNNLADQLGQRLQFKYQMLANSDAPEAKAASKTARQDATLCYLAARRLEKVVSIWIDEMREEEQSSNEATYTAHALALQSFIEKVAVFTAATGYVDKDLATPTESAAAAEAGARTYKLAGLYDRFYEYADLLATQGEVGIAAKYVQMTPIDYHGTGAAGSELDKARHRLFRAAGVVAGPSSSTSTAFGASKAAPAPAATRATGGYNAPPAPYGSTPVKGPSYGSTAPYGTAPSYGQPPATSPAPPSSQSYAPTQSYGYDSPYAPAQPSQPQPGAGAGYQPNQGSYGAPPPQPNYGSYGTSNGYGPPDPQPQGYGAPTGQFSGQYGAPPPGPPSSLAPPPRAQQSLNGTDTPPLVPASQRRDLQGWNDAPSLAGGPKRPTSAAPKEVKPAPIMSPFPMSESTPAPGPPHGAPHGMPPPHGMGQPPSGGMGMNQNQGPPMGITPPPPRTTPGILPPPPKGGPRPPSAQALARATNTSTPPVGGPPPRAPPSQPPQQQQSLSPPQQYSAQTPSAGPPPPMGGPRPPSANRAGGPPPPGVLAGPPPPRALSPLGPPGRTGSPLGVGGGTRQGQMQTMSLPSGGAAPRTGGPPPPGRRSSVQSSQPQGASPPIAQGSSVPQSPKAVAPAKALHPSGDRSHIPSSSKPIFEILNGEMERVKQMQLRPELKRIVDDTDRRLNILFDSLNNETVPKEALDKMMQIARAVQAHDANTALALHVELLTTSSEIGSWTPGVKQLIRLGL